MTIRNPYGKDVRPEKVGIGRVVEVIRRRSRPIDFHLSINRIGGNGPSQRHAHFRVTIRCLKMRLHPTAQFRILVHVGSEYAACRELGWIVVNYHRDREFLGDGCIAIGRDNSEGVRAIHFVADTSATMQTCPSVSMISKGINPFGKGSLLGDRDGIVAICIGNDDLVQVVGLVVDSDHRFADEERNIWQIANVYVDGQVVVLGGFIVGTRVRNPHNELVAAREVDVRNVSKGIGETTASHYACVPRRGRCEQLPSENVGFLVGCVQL